ncbi:MAG TPA: STAS domain-containing protein [Nocardioides sp.]|nr:STAS domain-containing protein [Nocardioides sp.]
MGATISTDLHDSGAVLVLAGDLDVRSTSEIRAALDEHLRVHGSATDGRVLVDLSDVTSIDETALKVLAAASRRARRRGGAVVLRGGAPAVRRMLHLTHLVRLFELERLPIPA